MIKTVTLKLKPEEVVDNAIISSYIHSTLGIESKALTGFKPIKKSIDARGKQIWINLSVDAFINEPFSPKKPVSISFKNCRNATNSVIIVGAGPAGMFAALLLLEKGIKPIIIERGKDIRSRRRDLALLNREGIINPDSNYCFGEGGAGTYSDGKLYTRSKKRGDVDRILHLLHQFGADDNILMESHPHIGTNKLPHIISSIRTCILEHGGEIHFNSKLVDLRITDSKIKSAITEDGKQIDGDACILATGHSARDIFELLNQSGIQIESKPFALGVRAEHPQTLIDRIQYHCINRNPFLPPASYSLVHQIMDKGVFSFCMCPGGIIAPASTAPGELVVNGWSPSKRNNPYANSGIVVEVGISDALKFLKQSGMGHADENDPLILMKFQQMVEKKSFDAGGGNFKAPAQRIQDFVDGKVSQSLPDCSYGPGIHSTNLQQVLPSFIHKRLAGGFREFGKKMKGYLTNEAIIVATESRTSSPVRIPRLNDSLNHPQIKNLYPCGEGAGYAGGIVSAAMDGEKVASQIAQVLK